jgi:hypothetical protein
MNVTTFADDFYWVYDGSDSTKASRIYVKPNKNWGGIEGPFDDVVYVRSGYMYFFTKHTYYRYNCATSLVRNNVTNCAVRKLKK